MYFWKCVFTFWLIILQQNAQCSLSSVRAESWTWASSVSLAGEPHGTAGLPVRGGAAALVHWQSVLRRVTQVIKMYLICCTHCTHRIVSLMLSRTSVLLTCRRTKFFANSEADKKHCIINFLHSTFPGFLSIRPSLVVSDNVTLSAGFRCGCQGWCWRARRRPTSLCTNTSVCDSVPVWQCFLLCTFLCWWGKYAHTNTYSVV